MFHIDPNSLYTLEDLERELAGIMSVETFLMRMSPRRRYKSAWWGQDLIEALNGPLPEERTSVREPLGRQSRRSPRLTGRRNSGLEPIRISGPVESCT